MVRQVHEVCSSVLCLGYLVLELYGAPLKVNIASDYVPNPDSSADMVTRLLIDISKRLYPQLQIDFMPASRIREWRTLEYVSKYLLV